MSARLFHQLRIVGSSRPASPRSAPENSAGVVVNPRALALCSLAEARRYLSYEQARSLKALPLGLVEVLGERTLTVATTSEQSQSVIAALRFAAELPVRVAEVPLAPLEEAIFIAYCGDDSRLLKDKESLRAIEIASSQGPEPISFRPKNSEVGSFLASLVEYGFSKGASDIHLVPRLEGTMVRMRVNGELLSNHEPLCALPLHHQLSARVKVLAGLDPALRHLPTDGSFAVPLANREGRVRVSTVPTLHGEKVVLRLLGGEGSADLSSLQFEAQVFDCLNQAVRRGKGAIIVAGPTGSGKTATLYGLAQYAAEMGRAVSSVEDPVERYLPSMAQTQVQESRGLTFSASLRSIVRQDPDVILVGEVRDAESAQIAIQAALTGHLLLSSVHAGTIPGIVQRLSSFGMDKDVVAETAAVFINQRLIPLLCGACKVIDLLGSRNRKAPVFRAVGCSTCDFSGFVGRAPLVQLFSPTEIGRRLLRKGAEFSLGDANIADIGFSNWDWQANKLLEAGQVTLESAEPYLVRT